MIGKIARDVRTALCVKQEEFAYKLGISREYYSKIENGKVEPSPDLTASIIETIKYFLVTHSQQEANGVTYRAIVDICMLLPNDHKAQLADVLRMKA
jgi:transcriptional regulator with XRE-family HTH domain